MPHRVCLCLLGLPGPLGLTLPLANFASQGIFRAGPGHRLGARFCQGTGGQGLSTPCAALFPGSVPSLRLSAWVSGSCSGTEGLCGRCHNCGTAWSAGPPCPVSPQPTPRPILLAALGHSAWGAPFPYVGAPERVRVSGGTNQAGSPAAPAPGSQALRRLPRPSTHAHSPQQVTGRT